MKTATIIFLIVGLLAFAGFESFHLKRPASIYFNAKSEQVTQKKKKKRNNRLIKWTLRKINRGRGYDFAHSKNSAHNYSKAALAEYIPTPAIPGYNYGDGQYFIADVADADGGFPEAPQQNSAAYDFSANSLNPIPEDVLKLLTEEQIELSKQTNFSADDMLKLIKQDKNLKEMALRNRETLLQYYPSNP